jgi:hypothetical protein
MTKSKAAFLFSAEKLWQPGFRVYFWTFTFPEVQADWDAMKRFSGFLSNLRKNIGGDWSGVRVAELHESHGVHFHALINRRLDVNLVRRIARWHGFGRIHVVVADQNGDRTAKYLAKYLSKARDPIFTKSGRRARRWSSFGPMKLTRVKDVVFECAHWKYRRAHNFPWVKSFRYEFLLKWIWDMVEDVKTWEAAWWCAHRGNMGDLCRIAMGQLIWGGESLVERVPKWTQESYLVPPPF